MSISMTITAETPAELFSAIKGAAAQIQTEPNATIPSPAAPAVPVQNPTPAPAATPASGVPQAAPYAPAAPGPAPIQMPPAGQTAPAAPVPNMPPISPQPAVPLGAAPTYSMDQIAKAGAELAQSGKINELLTLLQQFGVQAVTQLKPEQLGPFAAALRGLGAVL